MAQNATTTHQIQQVRRAHPSIKLAAIGKNVSNTMVYVSKSENATVSSATNKTGESVNATANELGKNASDMGSNLLNKTGEVAKKIGEEAATVQGNIGGEIKKRKEIIQSVLILLRICLFPQRMWLSSYSIHF